MNTQKTVKERPDRPICTNHAEVPADGVTAHGYTKPQVARKHELADSQLEKGAHRAGTTKVADRTTEGRHIVVEDGFESGKRRAAEISRARKASESNIVSLRKTHHVQSVSMDGGKGRVPFSGKK